jgi:ribonuclease BN (tRNA processing enzyme)
VRLLVLGSSGSSPARGNPASGYLVTHGDTSIWVDAGPGTLMALLDAIDPAELTAIVISHTHLDHSTDFLGFFHYVEYGPGAPRLPVFVPSGAAEHFGGYVASRQDHPFWSAFDFRVGASGRRADLGQVTLSFADARHSVPAIAVRIEAEGRSLVYTGDTGPSDDVARLAAGADVLLIEASLQGAQEDACYEFHMTASGAAALGRSAAVGRLILTHVPPTLDLERSVGEAAEIWGDRPDVAFPGMQVEI